MRDELKKKKKVSQIKNIVKGLGPGGIKDAVSENTKKKVGETVKNTVKSIGKVSKPIGSVVKDSLEENKAKKTTKSAKDIFGAKNIFKK